LAVVTMTIVRGQSKSTIESYFAKARHYAFSEAAKHRGPGTPVQCSRFQSL